MKYLFAIIDGLTMAAISGCQTDNLLGLDDSAIEVLARDKNVIKISGKKKKQKT